jgi:hypothetical protein
MSGEGNTPTDRKKKSLKKMKKVLDKPLDL